MTGGAKILTGGPGSPYTPSSYGPGEKLKKDRNDGNSLAGLSPAAAFALFHGEAKSKRGGHGATPSLDTLLVLAS